MPPIYQKGGQKRTIQFYCGFVICGHPSELTRRVKLHQKTCDYCKNGQNINFPEFNKLHGRMNGWNGLSMKGIIQDKDKLCFASIGEDILLDGVKLEEVYKIREAEQQKKSDSDDVKR
jgi:hypothetical protein